MFLGEVSTSNICSPPRIVCYLHTKRSNSHLWEWIYSVPLVQVSGHNYLKLLRP